jgi:hypothetical protein
MSKLGGAKMTIKHIADGFVIGSVAKGMITPVVAIFSGELWGSGAFLGGAIVVASLLFGEFYFREPVDEV